MASSGPPMVESVTEPGVTDSGLIASLKVTRTEVLRPTPVAPLAGPIETTEGTLVMSAIRDISDRKKAEQKFR